MAHKRLLFRNEALPKVLKGATALAAAMRITLGPKSKSVLIHKKWGRPIVCNDGVTIAKAPGFGERKKAMMQDMAILTGGKLVRLALENAVSVASVLLLSEATLTELPEEPRKEE